MRHGGDVSRLETLTHRRMGRRYSHQLRHGRAGGPLRGRALHAPPRPRTTLWRAPATAFAGARRTVIVPVTLRACGVMHVVRRVLTGRPPAVSSTRAVGFAEAHTEHRPQRRGSAGGGSRWRKRKHGPQRYRCLTLVRLTGGERSECAPSSRRARRHRAAGRKATEQHEPAGWAA